MQQIFSRLFARLMKSWSWVLLILLTILIKWASWYPNWVENNFSRGIYPLISKIQRLLFGWLPFSAGDLFYAFITLLIIYKTIGLIKAIFKKRVNRKYFVSGLQQVFFFLLFMYVFFNLLWGLNYNRRGIAHQLKLDVKTYTMEDLDTLTTVLQQRLNYYADFVTEAQRDSFNKKKILFRNATNAYAELEKKYSFLDYKPRSVKPSIYSYLGNYLGFSGYYNPFSGEAQVNTTIPRFLEPFVALHEIAHQLGYAKENEANFVGFLAARSYSSNNAFSYSAYNDMYRYAIAEVNRRDMARGLAFNSTLHEQVKKDFMEMFRFYKKYSNPVGTFVMKGYGEFLKANNQPTGIKSYNEVVAWLIAYYKKFGVDAL